MGWVCQNQLIDTYFFAKYGEDFHFEKKYQNCYLEMYLPIFLLKNKSICVFEIHLLFEFCPYLTREC